MSLLTWIVLFTLVGGVLSVCAAALYLLLSEVKQQRVLPHAVSFATGALLGTAFLAVLPHALEGPVMPDIDTLMFAALGGMLGFFLLEKLVLWRHSHGGELHTDAITGRRGGPAAGTLILIGDSLHNFFDGVLIAAAFLADIGLGIVTALAIAAHKIPQEVGDFAVLIHSGFSRSRAFFYNAVQSGSMVLGGLVAYYGLRDLQQVLPYVLAVAASCFIYVAAADLIPGLHRHLDFKATVQQMTLILAGVAVVYLGHSTIH